MNHAEQNNQESKKILLELDMSLWVHDVPCALGKCDNRTFRRTHVGQFV